MALIKNPSLFSSKIEGKRVTDDPFTSSAGYTVGESNIYLDYSSQIAQIIEMKKGGAEFGSWTLNTVINFLSAFILGENAIPYYTGTDDKEREAFNNWTRDFLSFNNTYNGTFRPMILEAVTFGRAVSSLRKETKNDFKKTEGVKLWCLSQENDQYDILNEEGNPSIPYFFWSPELSKWQIKLSDSGKMNSSEQTLESIKDNLQLLNFSLVADVNEPSYKPHFVLTEIENMDRALKNIRSLNEKGARITPVWEVSSDAEYNKLTTVLKKITWKIGQAVIGTGKFKYEVADTGKAVKGLMQEFEMNGQAVSATCNIPVHYIALTELMSNRSTAETLYDVILHGTANERETLKDYLKDMYIKAQQMYIDSVKDSELTKVITDFTVPIEVIDKSRFKEMVEAYSILHTDGIISKAGYRKIVPNVDPKEEADELAKEEEYRRLEADSEPKVDNTI